MIRKYQQFKYNKYKLNKKLKYNKIMNWDNIRKIIVIQD